MEKLLKETTAYKILSGDRRADRLSHAYLLDFPDPENMRRALKFFALEFFGTDSESPTGRRILNGSYPDFKIYPEDEKLTAEVVNGIIADSALRPVEGYKKLYAISDFENATPLLQNKLLKTLEEPLEGIYFLLGAASLAPVLDTVKSRTKILTVSPFTEGQIFAALEREGRNELNAAAAAGSGGILGVAENMVGGGWFKEVKAAAEEICATVRLENAGAAAIKYGATKYRTELLSQMQREYFSALGGRGKAAEVLSAGAIIYALEELNGAFADLKFNANFQALLYDFLLKVVKENEKWQRLRQ